MSDHGPYSDSLTSVSVVLFVEFVLILRGHQKFGAGLMMLQAEEEKLFNCEHLIRIVVETSRFHSLTPVSANTRRKRVLTPVNNNYASCDCQGVQQMGLTLGSSRQFNEKETPAGFVRNSAGGSVVADSSSCR